MERIAPLELPARMASSDAFFWYGERALPGLRPYIGGLFLLDREPDGARLERALSLALRAVPRLRQRVVEVPLHLGLPEWREDPHFDRRYHVRRVALPTPGDRTALLELVGALFAAPLDPERPLWEATTILGLEGGRAVFFLKMHHAVVDGVGSLQLLRVLTQAAPSDPLPRLVRSRRGGGRATHTGVLSLAADQARTAARLGLRAATLPLRAIRSPRQEADELARLVRGLRGLVEEVTRPVVPDPLADRASGLSRRVDVLELPLERLRKLRGPLGATLNDLLLAALAGALGAWRREHRVPGRELCCMVPVNLRGRNEADQLGNRVGAFQVMLPVAERDPLRRLERIRAQTHAAKRDRRAAAMPLLIEASTLLPGFAHRWLAREALRRVNLVCTNIPGPPERRFLAGATVEALFPLVSVVEHLPVVVAALSYAGRLQLGLDTDPEALPVPDRLAAHLEAAVGELEALADRRAVGGRGPTRAAGPPTA